MFQICAVLVSVATNATYLAGIVGGILGFLFEWFTWLASFTWKRLIVMAVCILLPVSALALACFVFACGGLVWGAESIQDAIGVGFVAYASSQLTHLAARQINPASRHKADVITAALTKYNKSKK